MKRTYYWIIIGILIASAAGIIWYLTYLHQAELDKVQNARFILISKQEMRLKLIDYKGDELFSAPVAVGMNAGNKKAVGDMRTPEGVFQVVDIQQASDWEHDFGDGKGNVKGAYGDYFIRLEVPGHKGIGIHGTHLPESIGTRASEGCIRMNNEELTRLVALIYPPLTVVITPGTEDEKINCNSK